MRSLALVALVSLSGCATSRAAAYERGYRDGWSLIRRTQEAGESGVDSMIDKITRRDAYVLGVVSSYNEMLTVRKTQRAGLR